MINTSCKQTGKPNPHKYRETRGLEPTILLAEKTALSRLLDRWETAFPLAALGHPFCVKAKVCQIELTEVDGKDS
jgi:hypothetical protein